MSRVACSPGSAPDTQPTEAASPSGAPGHRSEPAPCPTSYRRHADRRRRTDPLRGNCPRVLVRWMSRSGADGQVESHVRDVGVWHRRSMRRSAQLALIVAPLLAGVVPFPMTAVALQMLRGSRSRRTLVYHLGLPGCICPQRPCHHPHHDCPYLRAYARLC